MYGYVGVHNKHLYNILKFHFSYKMLLFQKKAHYSQKWITNTYYVYMEVLNVDVSGLKYYTKQVGFYDIPNMEITIRK